MSATLPVTTAEGKPAVDLQRMVRRPLPLEVQTIFKEVSRYQYELLTDAGWCVSCYRQRNNGTKRCNECAEKWRLRQEERARIAGNKPWQSGKRGRPPKSANNQVSNMMPEENRENK